MTLAEPTAPRRPRHVSPSSLDTYRTCAKKYHYKYILKVPDPVGEPGVRGKLAHAMLERLMSCEPAQRTEETARQVATEAWLDLRDGRGEASATEEYLELQLDKQGQQKLLQGAWNAVRWYLNFEDVTAIDVVSVERRIESTLNGVPFNGVVDVIDRTPSGLRVTDYKTGRVPQPQYVAERLVQVYIYAAWLWEHAEPVRSIRLLYLPGGELADTVDFNDVADIREMVATTWASIQSDLEAGIFRARPGRRCSWCPYSDRCPASRA